MHTYIHKCFILGTRTIRLKGHVSVSIYLSGCDNKYIHYSVCTCARPWLYPIEEMQYIMSYTYKGMNIPGECICGTPHSE